MMNDFLLTYKTKIIEENFIATTWLESPDFVSLIELARKIFKTQYVYITHFKGDALTVTSHIEFRSVDIPRHLTFCDKTIAKRDLYIVEDALQDDYFKDNPYVLKYFKYRFYAGVPIFLPDGSIFGTFCIFDTTPHILTDSQKRILRLLAAQTASFIKLHNVARNHGLLANQLLLANSAAIASDAVLNTMHDGVLVQDGYGKIISCNPAALRILAIEHDSLININDFKPDWKIFDENYNAISWGELPSMIALKTRKLVENSIIGIETEKGKVIWLKISSTPLFEEGNPEPVKIVSSFTDITESKNYSEALQELAKIAEDANKSKSTFLANVSHEIRTPLNGVVGIADALSRTNLDDKQRDMVELIKSAGKTLGLLLNDVLDMSKIEAGKLSLEILPLDIKEVISSAALLVKFQADAKKIDFELKFNDNMHRYYFGDMVRIRQIVTNLASNAVKFTSHGKVTICIDPIEIKNGVDSARGIKITVNDTGIGIKKEDLDNLFNRYIQADDSITRKFGGTGLGLSISKDLLELMDGQITVNSQLGIGSSFSATIPLEACRESELSHEPEQIQDAAQGSYYRVLLAEDHSVNQKVFGILTEPFGFNTLVVSNGRDALEAFKNQKFDMIFMDIKMPILDGIETTRQVRDYEAMNRLKPTKIIMLSANTESNYTDIAKDAGADYFLGKPFDVRAIIDLLQKIEAEDNSFKKLNIV